MCARVREVLEVTHSHCYRHRLWWIILQRGVLHYAVVFFRHIVTAKTITPCWILLDYVALRFIIVYSVLDSATRRPRQ